MSLTLRPPPFPLTSKSGTRSRKSQTENFSCFSTGKPNSRISSSELGGAPDLATPVVQRIKTQLQERENAMKRSKQLLFSELCQFLNMESGEAKTKWEKMSSDERLGLVKGFVSDWGSSFHPLSPRSVRDMVDEFVTDDTQERLISEASSIHQSSSSGSAVILPRLKKLLMGLSQND